MPRSDQFLTTGSIIPESQLPAPDASGQDIAAKYIREHTEGAPTLRVTPAPTPQGFTVPGTSAGALGVKPDLQRIVTERMSPVGQGLLGVAQGILGLSSSGERLLRYITNPILPKSAETAPSAPTGAELLGQQAGFDINETYTHYQGAGKIIGESLPYFATGGFAAPIGEAVAGRLATAAPRLASSALGRSAVNLLGKAAGEVATSVPVTAALTGGDVREIGWDTATSAALPFVGKALGGIAKPAILWISDLAKSTNIHVPKILGLPAPQSFTGLPSGIREALEAGNYKPGATVYINNAGDVVSPATVPPPEIERAMQKYFWIMDTLKNRGSANMTSESIRELIVEANDLARKVDTWSSGIEEVSPRVTQGATPSMARADDLIQEARKYKSAEEFVKAQGQKYIHETNADNIKTFDIKRAGENTGDSWLGRGVYLQQDGAFKLEKYGKNKVEAFISPKAKIFEINDTPKGKWRDSFVEEMSKKFPDMEKQIKEDGRSLKNVLSRDFLMNKSPEQIRELIGNYDGILQDGELVVFNPDVLKTKSQLTDIWNKAQTPQEKLTAKKATQVLREEGRIQGGDVIQPTASDIGYIKPKAGTIITSRTTGDVLESTTERLSPSQIREVLIRGDRKPVKAKIGEAINTLKDDFLDRFDAFRQLSDDAAKAGKALAPGADPNKLVSRVTSAASIADQYIDDNLRPVLERVGNQESVDNLNILMVAQRAEELAKGGKGKGADLVALKGELGDAEFNRLSKIATDIRKYAHGLLEQLKKSGIISPEEYKAIKSSNEFYTPFFKVVNNAAETTLVETKRGLNVSNNTLDRIKEGLVEDAAIKNPLAALLAQTYNITRAVESNRVMKALADTGNFIRHESAPTGKPYITLMDNGKKVYYEVDKRIADAVSGLTVEDLNVAVKLLAAPAKLLRVGATTLNVGFAVPNAIRDQYSAMVKAKYGFNPINFIQGIAATFKRDDLFKEWVRNGGDQSGMFAQDMSRLNRSVDQLTGNESNWVKAGRIVSSPIELIRTLGDFTEKGTRLGVFKRAMEGAQKEGLTKGWSDFDIITESIHQSRNASVDFARAGSKMRAVNALIPFLNARLQGSVGLIRAFQDNPKQAAAVGTAIATVPAIALYMHNRNYPEYDEVPQYIKDQYFVIMTGDDTVPFIKIPKGEVGRLFANPAESFLDFAYNKGDKTFSDLAVDMLSAISPVSGVNDVMPTALKVPYELMANYDTFRGRNIVSPYQKDLPPEMQFNERTSETAKILGKLTNTSPAKIEHAILGFTAGIGGQTLQLTDLMLGKKPKVGELPIMSRLLGKETDLSVSATKIYEEADKEKQATMMDNAMKKNAIKKALSTGDSASLINTIDSIEPSKRKTMINDVLKDMREATLAPKLKAISKIESTKVKAKVIANELENMDRDEAQQFIGELTKSKILDKNTLKELNIQRNGRK